MNNSVVCCIFSYKADDNAKRLYTAFKDTFDTYIFDTFHQENGDVESAYADLQPDGHIRFFNNFYFGGCYCEAYRLSVELGARWCLIIPGDVEIDDENLEKIKTIINDEISVSTDIGTYQASFKEGSCCYGTTKVLDKNKHLFNQHTDGLREYSMGEDNFFMFRVAEVHRVFDLYLCGNYKYGWGIGYGIVKTMQAHGFKTVIDDRVEVFHPYSRIYNYEEADKEYFDFYGKYSEAFYNFTTYNISTKFDKNPLDKDRYLVLTCAKNEDRYLTEFVGHYLNLGFDKVIIADNNDEPTIYPILEPYLIKGTVEIWNCRKFGSFQVQLYAMFANEGNYKWCGYFDADEFLEIGCYSNIKDYLATVNEDCVSFNWINFGSNGEKHYNEGKLSERFPRPVEPIVYFKENMFIKSIVRGGDCWKGCWFNGSHLPFISKEKEEGDAPRTGTKIYNIGGYYLTDVYTHAHMPFRYKQGYIKHYYTKSFDEWMVKANRGWPDGTDNLKASVFFGYENKTEFNFDRFIHVAFGDDSDYYRDFYNNSKFFKEILDNYSVIQILDNDNFIYGLVIDAICLMKVTTNHTFVFDANQVDDALFTMLLECAFYTGNRAVCSRNNDETWQAFLKYHNKNEGTYYIVKA